MRKLCGWVAILIVVLFVVGCAVKQQAIEVPIMPTEMSSDGKSYTSTITVTQVQSSTPIKTITPEYTATPDEGMYSVVDELPGDVLLNGQIVYSYISEDERIGLLYDLQTKDEYILTDHFVGASGIQVSPNSEWMFYVPYDNDPATANYILLKKLQSNENQIIEGINGRLWSGQIWLNENEILAPNVAIHNIVNHSEKLINNEFPGFDYYHVAMYTFIPVIDPSGTYVVYSTLLDTGSAFELYNMESEKVINQYPVLAIYDVKEPEWSHDGSKFFYANRTEDLHLTINVVLKNGEVTQIADLYDEVSSTTVQQKNWSPDDKYIAFQVLHSGQMGEIPKNNLFIIDVDKSKVFETGILVSSDSPVGAPMFWSPDSSQIIMENKISENENEIILLDLASMESGIVMRNVNLYGWISVPDLSVYQLYSGVAKESIPTPTLVNSARYEG